MTWTSEWVAAGRAAQERADSQCCDTCGSQKAVGYSNLGIPMAVCPTCNPTLVANGKRSVGEAWGFSERQ